MRTLTSGEAAELLGVDHTYLRKLHREGKIVDVETTAGSHRRYSLDDIWEIRQTLEGKQRGLELTCLVVATVTSFKSFQW